MFLTISIAVSVSLIFYFALLMKVNEIESKTIKEFYENRLEFKHVRKTLREHDQKFQVKKKFKLLKDNSSRELVVIESPYSNSNRRTVEENTQYALMAMKDSLERGEAPLASHLLYTRVLDDNKSKERSMGMESGFAWNKYANKVVVYQDYGISSGMKKGIELAEKHGIVVVYRNIIKE